MFACWFAWGPHVCMATLRILMNVLSIHLPFSNSVLCKRGVWYSDCVSGQADNEISSFPPAHLSWHGRRGMPWYRHIEGKRITIKLQFQSNWITQHFKYAFSILEYASIQAILIVRFGLNNVLKALAGMSKSPVQWDKSKLYYVLREVCCFSIVVFSLHGVLYKKEYYEVALDPYLHNHFFLPQVYQPLELLLFIASLCLIADTFLPSLISVTRVGVTATSGYARVEIDMLLSLLKNMWSKDS